MKKIFAIASILALGMFAGCEWCDCIHTKKEKEAARKAPSKETHNASTEHKTEPAHKASEPVSHPEPTPTPQHAPVPHPTPAPKPATPAEPAENSMAAAMAAAK